MVTFERLQFESRKLMKIFVQLLVCIMIGCVFWGCKTCTIEPPPTGVQTNKEAGAKAAASALTTAVSQGSIEGNYRNVVNTTYATVGQDDVALYLLLKASECESDKGHVAQANQLLDMARVELAKRHDASGAAVAENPTTLTPVEKKVLKTSPLKEDVKKTLEASKPAATSTSGSKPTHKAKPKPSPSPSQ
jgi:hypothetical protein